MLSALRAHAYLFHQNLVVKKKNTFPTPSEGGALLVQLYQYHLSGIIL